MVGTSPLDYEPVAGASFVSMLQKAWRGFPSAGFYPIRSGGVPHWRRTVFEKKGHTIVSTAWEIPPVDESKLEVWHQSVWDVDQINGAMLEREKKPAG